MTGKVALVTGASRGIGRELALGLAGQGADVVVNYASAVDRAQAVVAEIEALGRRAVAIRADVSQPEDAQRLADEAKAAMGRIDILVNNA
ncbi:MAG TPA: short-chain dehydrogenase, partial [Citreicella sp.]|nr:short-chain dehydrogenase [Citreicella sp.]